MHSKQVVISTLRRQEQRLTAENNKSCSLHTSNSKLTYTWTNHVVQNNPLKIFMPFFALAWAYEPHCVIVHTQSAIRTAAGKAQPVHNRHA